MLKDEYLPVRGAADTADEIAAAIRDGRTGDALTLLPGMIRLLTALRPETELGIENARKVLGPLAAAARDHGAITYLTSHGSRIAAIVPVHLAEQAAPEEGL